MELVIRLSRCFLVFLCCELIGFGSGFAQNIVDSSKNVIQKTFEDATKNEKHRLLYDYQTRVVAYKDLIDSKCLLEILTNEESVLSQRLGNFANRSDGLKPVSVSNQLSKREIWRLAGQRILDFCRGFPTYLVQNNQQDAQSTATILYVQNDFPVVEEMSRKRRRKREPRYGNVRGQTQSQYLNFGNNPQSGKAEAESTANGTKAVVTGTSGMGQAQSQSSPIDCGECLGNRFQDQTLQYGRGSAGAPPERLSVSGGRGYPGSDRPNEISASGGRDGSSVGYPGGTSGQPGIIGGGTYPGQVGQPGGAGYPGRGSGQAGGPYTGQGGHAGGYPDGDSRQPGGVYVGQGGQAGGAGYPGGSSGQPGSTYNGQGGPAGGAGYPSGSFGQPGGLYPGQGGQTGGAGYPGGGSGQPGGVYPGQGGQTGAAVYPGGASGQLGGPYAGQSVPAGGAGYPGGSSGQAGGPYPGQGGQTGAAGYPAGASGQLGGPYTGQGGQAGGPGAYPGSGFGTGALPGGYPGDGYLRPMASGGSGQIYPGGTDRGTFDGNLNGRYQAQSGQAGRFAGTFQGTFETGSGAHIPGELQKPGIAAGGYPGTVQPVGPPGGVSSTGGGYPGGPGGRYPGAGGTGGAYAGDQTGYPGSGGQVTGRYPGFTPGGGVPESTGIGGYPGTYPSTGVGPSGTSGGGYVQPTRGSGYPAGGAGVVGGTGYPGSTSDQIVPGGARYPGGTPGQVGAPGTGAYPGGASGVPGGVIYPSGGQPNVLGSIYPGGQIGGGTGYTTTGGPVSTRVPGPVGAEYTGGTASGYPGSAGGVPGAYPGLVSGGGVAGGYPGGSVPPGGSGTYPGTYPGAGAGGQNGGYIGGTGSGVQGGRYPGAGPSGYPGAAGGTGYQGYGPSGGGYTYPSATGGPQGTGISGQGQGYLGQGGVAGQGYPGQGGVAGQGQGYPGQRGVAGQGQGYPGQGGVAGQGQGYPGQGGVAGQGYPGQGGVAGQGQGYPGQGGVAGQGYPGQGGLAGQGQGYPGQGGVAGQGQGYPGQGGVTGQGIVPPGQYVAPGGQGGAGEWVDGKWVPADGTDDSDSQVLTSVQQSNNETIANAEAHGKFLGGTSQSQVSGTYTGSGSFSASAGSDDGKRGALTEVHGGKGGAQSSAQGRGGAGKSQAEVTLDSETGDTLSTAQTSGIQHGTQTQVQASEKGGLADSQANGPGATSSQAQIGFTPYDENEKDNQISPFTGGGTAAAQSGNRSGMTQTEIQGHFKFGIRYQGAAQAGSGSTALRNLTDPSGFFKPLNFTVAKVTYNRQSQSQKAVVNLPPKTESKSDLERAESREKLFDMEVVHETLPPLPPEEYTTTTEPPEVTTFVPTTTTTSTTSSTTTTTLAPPLTDYDDYADYNDDDFSNEEANEQLVQSSMPSRKNLVTSSRRNSEVKSSPRIVTQSSPTQRQHIVLNPLEKLDATVHQSKGDFPDDGAVLNAGQIIPGSPGFQIPAGFRGKVKSIANGPNTYTIGKNSQAQSVTLSPGNGRIYYSRPATRPIYAVSTRTLYKNGNYGTGYTYQPAYHPVQYRVKSGSVLPNFVSVSKSEAGSQNLKTGKRTPNVYYTQSSSCGMFTNSCMYVGGKKTCFPVRKTNPDGSLMSC